MSGVQEQTYVKLKWVSGSLQTELLKFQPRSTEKLVVVFQMFFSCSSVKTQKKASVCWGHVTHPFAPHQHLLQSIRTSKSVFVTLMRKSCVNLAVQL